MARYIVNKERTTFLPHNYNPLGWNPSTDTILSGLLSEDSRSFKRYGHEVHRHDCFCVARMNEVNIQELGHHDNDRSAVRLAQQKYWTELVDGCYWCCRAEHRG